MEAVFKMQSESSFKPYAYWSKPQIHIRGEYIDIDLNAFKPTVTVSTYPVWQYASGVKPSADVNLGVIGFLKNADWGKIGVWHPNGTLDLIAGVSSSDNFVALPRRIPVPTGITFS